MFGFFRKRRRAGIRKGPFPREWLVVLKKNFSLYSQLPEEDQAELCGHIQVFIDEKNFEGCGGLQMDDEIRVTIAAQACLLLLRRETDYYPDLASILVYPKAYLASTVSVSESGVVSEGVQTRLGESWRTGSIVLAWDSVKQGGVNSKDGHNVVFHEFAHQLDGEDGTVSGSPVLGKGLRLTERRSKYLSWIRVFQSEFEQLRCMQKRNRKTLIDYYGATNEAEFFAVVTEHFFEEPKQLQKKHPELYSELKDYFKQDPVSWKRSG